MVSLIFFQGIIQLNVLMHANDITNQENIYLYIYTQRITTIPQSSVVSLFIILLKLRGKGELKHLFSITRCSIETVMVKHGKIIIFFFL